MIEPAWLDWAVGEWRADVREVPGPEHHPRILEYFRLCGADWVTDDETPWCAAAVGAALVSTLPGIVLPRGPLRARSYLAWGERMVAEASRPGALAVFSRGAGAQPGPEVIDAPGHIAILLASASSEVFVLGANQGDAWSIRAYPHSRLLGLRWPPPGAEPGPRYRIREGGPR